MYSNEDISQMFDNLKDNVTANTDNEISYYLNMNAIFVQLLLHQADEQKVGLKVETSQVQNMKNVNEMDEFVKSLSQTLPNSFGKQNVISKLNSITKTQNLINDFEQLKNEHEVLKEEYHMMKNKNEMLVNEVQNLQAESQKQEQEINSLRAQIKVSWILIKNRSAEDGKDIDSLGQLQKDLEATKKNYDEQAAKYQNLLKDYDVKLSQSSQFQQLKKMLLDKNNLIIQLKKKLTEFEEQPENWYLIKLEIND